MGKHQTEEVPGEEFHRQCWEECFHESASQQDKPFQQMTTEFPKEKQQHCPGKFWLVGYLQTVSK